MHWAICNIKNQKGDLPIALKYAEDGLLLARDLSDPLYISYLLLGLGWNAYLRSDYKKANACLDECLAIRRDLGVRSFLLSPLISLAPVAIAQGEEEQARNYFSEALDLFTITGKYWILSDCFERMSGLSILSPECVAAILANAASMRAKQGTVTPASERRMLQASLENARARLGEEVFQSIWAEGEAMSSNEAINFVIQSLSE